MRFGVKNYLKPVADAVALFVLHFLLMALMCQMEVHAAIEYPTGDLQAPPAIIEIHPEAEDSATEAVPYEDGLILRKNVIGQSLNAYPVDTGDHYKYLSEAEKAVYIALYRSISAGNYIPYSKRSVKYDFSVIRDYKTLVYSGDSNFQTAYGLGTFEYENIINRASEAVYFDHPDRVEFYMCHTTYYWTAYENGVYNSYIVITAGFDNTKFQALDNEINASLSVWINELRSPANNCINSRWNAITELKVHDYYVSHLTYDNHCAHDTTESGYYNLSHTAYGALCKRSAVCDGYSAGFELILEKLGIDTMIIAGYASGGHAWNIVRLDGAWYEVDTTWAIPSEGSLGHEWFNRTTADFSTGIGSARRKHLRTGNASYVGFRMPTAYGTHYNYSYIANTTESALRNDENYIALKGMNLEWSSLTMNIGEKMAIYPEFTPANATVRDFRVNTSNYGVVEANGNEIVAVSPGSAVITAISDESGYKAVCSITVTGDPSAVNSAAPMSVGSEIIISKGSSKGVYVVTSSEYATVSYRSSGKKSVGKVKIPATVADGSGCRYTVTQISANAFKGNKKLKSVVIPSTVTEIGQGAFKNCSNLSDIKIYGKSMKTVGGSAFKGIKKEAGIRIYAQSKSRYQKLVKLIKRAGGSNSVYKYKKKS